MRKIYLFAVFLLACSAGNPTFMGICKGSNHIYLPRGNDVNSLVCTKPEVVSWPGLPLGVDVDDEVAADYSSSVREAVKFWNRQLDMPVFATSGLEPRVHVVMGSALSVGENAAGFYTDEYGQLHCQVELRQPGDITDAYYDLAHEFGHCLGLAHDSNTLSVMYPVSKMGSMAGTSYDWDADDMFHPMIVVGGDREALRKKYRR